MERGECKHLLATLPELHSRSKLVMSNIVRLSSTGNKARVMNLLSL